MIVLTPERIKTHLRLPLDADTELDAQLENIEAAAVDYASQYLNREIPWDSNEVPASVEAALLLIISDLFENREGQNTQNEYHSNPAVERLLHFYRVGLGV